MANVNDIITLARAGYTAEQISVILNATAQPVQQIPAQPVQQIPAQPVQQIPAQPVQQIPAQPVQQIPAQPVQQIPAQPVQQIPAQPVQQIPAQPVDPVLEQLKQLTGLVQMNNINGSTMPAKQSAEDIVASIINPPVKQG